jgi:hypothetical protein
MNRGYESVRKAVDYGHANGKTTLIVGIEEMRELYARIDALTAEIHSRGAVAMVLRNVALRVYVNKLHDAVAASHEYHLACARQWAANDGRILEGQAGAVVVGADLDRLAEVAAAKVMAIMTAPDPESDSPKTGNPVVPDTPPG